MYAIAYDEMLRSLLEVLVDSLLLWYRNNSSEWSRWEQFPVAFKAQYFPLDLDDTLIEDMNTCIFEVLGRVNISGHWRP